MPELNEERRLIQQSAREFTRAVVRPTADRLDPVKGDIPRELIEQMADLGYFGILIPEEYGGLGLGAFEYCLVAEELARGWMSVASLIARGNALIGSLKAMTEDQKQIYLPRMAKGEFLGAFSLSEPDAGSDIANISCRARRVGDEWEITGNKYWCTFADGADFIMVFARTDANVDPKARHRGISAFMIEKPRGQLPQGVSEALSRRSAILVGRPGNWPSTNAACLPQISSVRKGVVSTLQRLGWKQRVRTLPRARSALRRLALTTLLPTLSNVGSSVSRSRPFRPFASKSPVWRPTSRRLVR